jgi:hypothetical protein
LKIRKKAIFLRKKESYKKTFDIIVIII